MLISKAQTQLQFEMCSNLCSCRHVPQWHRQGDGAVILESFSRERVLIETTAFGF